MTHYFCGRDFYTFLFETNEDQDMIIRGDPYFFSNRVVYLNRWTLEFNLELDVPWTIPVWVRLSRLPLHCWKTYSLKNIGNSLGKYIDSTKPKGNMFACAQICVEVDLEKGLP